ncbi:gamma-glutamylcyclotransferase family protein [Actomonas aquatica]|uniref:Gamma-glutamylcyclotransferase family protein n=1 Tax=Actomonas aquatica TaxID=2866162 RepID=A0ABZ1C7B4_9BACT|nr:gamma-glutamylcyclotransferase family protein [Opitutus sp. WL0086]WRQ87484.1 gamma-glutamylcyclotransferase family protein [Opitutus sp. WL0086]
MTTSTAPTTAPTRHRVFVYGTLKQGGSNHAFLEGQTYLGDARTVPGYKLYLVADYPGMVRDPSDQRGVTGELWEVDTPTLAELDRLEGIDEKLYRRDPIPLLPPHDTTPVETYIYLRNIRGRRPFVDGHWPVRFPAT